MMKVKKVAKHQQTDLLRLKRKVSLEEKKRQREEEAVRQEEERKREKNMRRK